MSPLKIYAPIRILPPLSYLAERRWDMGNDHVKGLNCALSIVAQMSLVVPTEWDDP